MEMDEARPAGAPALPQGEEGWDIGDLQMQAFVDGDPDWWTVGLEDRDAAEAVVEVKSAGAAAHVELAHRVPRRVEPVQGALTSTLDEPCAIAARKAGFGPAAAPVLRA